VSAALIVPGLLLCAILVGVGAAEFVNWMSRRRRAKRVVALFDGPRWEVRR
jgi:hypothetical protein